MTAVILVDHLDRDDSQDAPPIKLGPDEDECIDPDVQLALRVGGVQQPDRHY